MTMRAALIGLIKHLESNPGCQYDGSLYDGREKREYECLTVARAALAEEDGK